MKSILFLLAICVALPALAADPSVIQIKLGTILPAGTSGHQRLMEMRDAWQKTSAQSVKLMVPPNSGDGEIQIVKKMHAGQLHAALISAVGLAQIDRSVTALQIMPLMFRDWREVDYVREKIRGDLEAKMRAQGFEVLFWADAGWVRFFSKDPAVHPADIKPMKMFVWTGEPHQLTILRGLGYQPVGLETDQIIPMLNTGMINVVPAPPFIANAGQYTRYGAKHMIELKWVPIVGAAVVRRDVWERIAPALRTELMKSAETFGERIRLGARDEDEAAIVAMQKRGLVVHPVSPAIQAEWRKLVEGVYPKIRGTIVPAELFDRVQQHVTEFRAANGDSK